MSEQLDFLTFKKLLNDNQILLFDGQYRIIHFRFNELFKNLHQSQIGGGIINEKPLTLIDKIKIKSNGLLEHFIDSLLEKNIIKTNYIINSIIN